jgi:hypothetical protein
LLVGFGQNSEEFVVDDRAAGGCDFRAEDADRQACQGSGEERSTLHGSLQMPSTVAASSAGVKTSQVSGSGRGNNRQDLA